MVQQNMRVFKFAVIFLMAALVFLAGCMTTPPESVPQSWSIKAQTNAPASTPISTATNTVHLAKTPTPAKTNLPPVVHTNVSPVPPKTVRTWTSLDRWAADNKIGPPVHLTSSPLSTWSIASSYGKFVLAIGSREVTWNGVSLHLGFPPEMADDQIFVHGLDLQKTLMPLLTGETWFYTDTNRVIVIDPGHGGINAGTLNVLGGPPEKVFTLDWAKRLAGILQTNGWKVYLTRTNDVDVTLLNRVAFAEAHHATVFISLHFNSSAPDKKQSGLETYCLTPTGMPSTLTRGYSDLVTDIYPNNEFDAQNLLLAMRVHEAVLRASGEEDRGIRRARFMGVLHGEKRPAILVEGGFLSNPNEAHRIEDPAFRQKLAEAVASALK